MRKASKTFVHPVIVIYFVKPIIELILYALYNDSFKNRKERTVMNVDAVIDYIVDWLDKYCEKAGSRGFVVGVSGGIDSAVTSTLAARTGRPVMCLEMPIHQAQSQVTRASNHIEFLQQSYANVSMVNVELTQVFDDFVKSVPAVDDENSRFLTLANSRSRLRMMTLYYFAGLNNDLVAGTGNKVEDFGVGFYTKYGDGGVDISPIADLLKSQVYRLGEALGVNASIIKAPPTDGLWGDDRTDEDQIGASYPELEWAMDYISKGLDQDLNPRQLEVLGIYKRFNCANQHKMQPIPVCLIPQSLKG